MSQISAISSTQRDPSRATIRVDRKHVATLTFKQIDALGLHVGQAWNDALAAQVAEAVAYDKAFRDATRRLARRAMSTKMLDDKLRDLGHDTAVRQRVLDRLIALQLLDDHAYGQALIRQTMRQKPAGPMLLRQKLMQKGVDRSLIDALVHEATQDDDQQLQDAIALAQRKLAGMKRLEPAVRKRRLYGQLARRGFTPDTIHSAFDALADRLLED